MTQAWICLSLLVFIASLALFLASMTVNMYIKIASGFELMVNLLTLHFEPKDGFLGPEEDDNKKTEEKKQKNPVV